MHFLYIAAASLIFCFATGAQAESAPKTWVTVGGVSRHFDRAKNFNEQNFGLGVERDITPDIRLIGGFYKNSVRRQTFYGGLAYTPTSIAGARAGVIVGAANGYPNRNGGGVFPIVSPVLMIEAGRVGANVLIIPSIFGAHGSVALQLKARF